MLAISPQSRIFIALEAVDFRRGMDGLSQRALELFNQHPIEGGIFVFRNRSGTSLKMVAYDGQGMWLFQKRFSKGRLRWWPRNLEEARGLQFKELQILLFNGNPLSAGMAPNWKPLAPQ